MSECANLAPNPDTDTDVDAVTPDHEAPRSARWPQVLDPNGKPTQQQRAYIEHIEQSRKTTGG